MHSAQGVSADSDYAKLVAARLSTTFAAATHIQPPTTSGRSWATTTGPAMHAEAERTERHLLAEMIAEVIQRRKPRRRARRSSWRAHVKTAQACRAGHERMAAAAATHTVGSDLDAGGLELRAVDAVPRKFNCGTGGRAFRDNAHRVHSFR